MADLIGLVQLLRPMALVTILCHPMPLSVTEPAMSTLHLQTDVAGAINDIWSNTTRWLTMATIMMSSAVSGL